MLLWYPDVMRLISLLICCFSNETFKKQICGNALPFETQ